MRSPAGGRPARGDNVRVAGRPPAGQEPQAPYAEDSAVPVPRRETSVDLDLGGKVAVVTGAGKGIGLAVTRALANEGAHVVAGSLTTDTLKGLDGVTPVPADLATPDGPARLVQRAINEHGRLDVLVNNVGAV